MADINLLGLFNNIQSAGDAIEKLRQMNIADEKITVMSGSPYRAEMFGRPHHKGRVALAAGGGVLLGLLLAAFLTAGIFLLYPLIQGGQPLIPIPPSLIVFFEMTMLGTMWAAFFGMLLLSGLPVFKQEPYDARITDGYIGVQAILDEMMASEIETAFKNMGAVDVKRETLQPAIDRKFWIFWGSVLGVVTVGGIISLLFFYEVLKINFPSNMVEQDSYGYDQGPRLAAPIDAVPIQGPIIIDEVPATTPVPVSPESLQRGSVLFGINCVMCHSVTGVGNGAVGAFFNPKPFDLTSSKVQALSDEQIFVVIDEGFGIMPSIAENLSASERWDVINHVRTLAK